MSRTTSPRVVVIGSGVVGAAVADELTARGWTDVTVLDRGALLLPGGSSSHAPGLVFQASPSRTLARFARYTVEKMSSLDLDGQWCFNQVGGLEVATEPARVDELWRRHGFLSSVGVESTVMLSPLNAVQPSGASERSVESHFMDSVCCSQAAEVTIAKIGVRDAVFTASRRRRSRPPHRVARAWRPIRPH